MAKPKQKFSWLELTKPQKENETVASFPAAASVNTKRTTCLIYFLLVFDYKGERVDSSVTFTPGMAAAKDAVNTSPCQVQDNAP